MSGQRRSFLGTLVLAGTLIIVVGILLSTADRVREEMTIPPLGVVPPTLVNTGSRATAMAVAITDETRTETADHALIAIGIVGVTAFLLLVKR